MKRIAILTVAGASVASVLTLAKRAGLRVQVDAAKARQAVKLTRSHGKHEETDEPRVIP